MSLRRQMLNEFSASAIVAFRAKRQAGSCQGPPRDGGRLGHTFHWLLPTLLSGTVGLHFGRNRDFCSAESAEKEAHCTKVKQHTNAVAAAAAALIDVEVDPFKIFIDGVDRENRRGSLVDDLNGYSILQCLATHHKQLLVDEAKRSNEFDRAMGTMVGMGVGDYLGAPLEFLPATSTVGKHHFDISTMAYHGEFNKFNLKRGQWTDDSSMGLCMADSLILKQCYDGSDIRIRFWCWWNRGYNNAFRLDSTRSGSVGLGGNIGKSMQVLTDVKAASEVTPTFEATGEDAGNGSLMRLTPIALFFRSAPFVEVHAFARASSYTTHPGIMAAESCALLGHIIVRALRLPRGPVDAKAFLDEVVEEYHSISGLAQKDGWGYDQMRQLVMSSPAEAKESVWNWKCEELDIEGTLRARGASYNGYPVSSGYFGSFCMDGLAMALHCIYHTKSFDEAVVKSVNLCGDCDSHGSITGQIAGALYGYSTINPQFIKWMCEWDGNDFAVRALLLHSLGGS